MNARAFGQKALTTVLVVLALIAGANTVNQIIVRWMRSADGLEARLGKLVGEALPAFSAIALGGESVAIPAVDRPTIVYFFSSTCTACEANEAAWRALSTQVGGRALIAMLSLEPEEAIARFGPQAGESHIVTRVDRRESQELQDAYKLLATPTLYVIDSGGVLRYVHVGVFTDGVAERVLAEIDGPN